ncbi:Calcium/proton antiporter, CaCA family [Lysobacter dokdonensis DS-58]|uniref:Ca(2+)/H(+) antiporter n=1 Tax=Lysobacter dokdonensis DS-58 TaxID=1300345 RepID=A0A0A2WJR6_9GAMM|nr:calcium/proton exchanger [Lysobacter dokdonensis]KGQ20043.1 Calcium/proton antiporter, CaCA family [Lysobacter dokdonensis DS-58]
MKWLLVFAPIALLLEQFAPDRTLLIFGTAAVAIVPLAGIMAQATGVLAERVGPSIGGLLNATFGNAAEFIICLAALREGLHAMVMASLAGAIIGNILLVMGIAMVVGGRRWGTQRYDTTMSRSLAAMLTLAVISMIMPAAYRAVVPTESAAIDSISVWIAVVLLAIYACSVIQTLRAAKSPASGDGDAHDAHGGHDVPAWSPKRAALILGTATFGVVVMSEILVAVIEPATESLGLSPAFSGVFVLAVLGGAAEAVSAIMAARGNRMDLAMSIAQGASVQLALLIAPLLVLLSYFVGPHPMPLVFAPSLVVSVLLATMISAQVSTDGRTDWFRGAQLLAVYLILAAVFFYAPGASE